MKRGTVRWVLLGVAVALVAGLFFSGALREFSLQRTADTIRSYGTFGAVLFVLAFACIQPLGVSGHTFVLSAALVWSPSVAFGLSLLGAVGSSLVNVAFARQVAEVPQRFAKWEAWIQARGFWGLTLFRAVTFTLHPAQLLVGVLKIPLPRLLLATAIGFTPNIVFDVWFGGELLKRLLAWLGYA